MSVWKSGDSALSRRLITGCSSANHFCELLGSRNSALMGWEDNAMLGGAVNLEGRQDKQIASN